MTNPAVKALEAAYQRTMATRYFWSLQVLWPNIAPIMWRMSEYVGHEIRPAPETPLLIDSIIGEIKTQLSDIEAAGTLRSCWLDRDVMVHFLRILLREVSRVHFLQVRSDDKTWDATQTGFNLWRQVSPGILKAEVKADFDSRGVSKIMMHQVATHLLSPLDWEVLGEDKPRLWSVDGVSMDSEQDEVGDEDADQLTLYH